MSLALLFHYLLFNMFRMLVHPSSGACELLWIYFMCCIVLVRRVLVLWCGSAGWCGILMQVSACIRILLRNCVCVCVWYCVCVCVCVLRRRFWGYGAKAQPHNFCSRKFFYKLGAPKRNVSNRNGKF